MTAQTLVGRNVKIFWPDDDAWYMGRVTAFDEATGQHHVGPETCAGPASPGLYCIPKCKWVCLVMAFHTSSCSILSLGAFGGQACALLALTASWQLPLDQGCKQYTLAWGTNMTAWVHSHACACAGLQAIKACAALQGVSCCWACSTACVSMRGACACTHRCRGCTECLAGTNCLH